MNELESVDNSLSGCRHLTCQQTLLLTTKLVKRTHVTDVLVDQELIIMDQNTQIYFGLNSVASKMWSFFDSKTVTLLELAHYLQCEYHLEEQQSIQDAQAFVDGLFVNRLIDFHT